ncbi:MAG: MGMT family protein [Candidatus Shapirobacteria bacterium]
MPATVFNRIRGLVCLIPPGFVATYGTIARALGYKNSRLVGFAIRGNQDTSIPCHRVVFKDGSLAANYSFGGSEAQRHRLEFEGITFTPEGRVKLSAHLFVFNNPFFS